MEQHRFRDSGKSRVARGPAAPTALPGVGASRQSTARYRAAETQALHSRVCGVLTECKPSPFSLWSSVSALFPLCRFLSRCFGGGASRSSLREGKPLPALLGLPLPPGHLSAPLPAELWFRLCCGLCQPSRQFSRRARWFVLSRPSLGTSVGRRTSWLSRRVAPPLSVSFQGCRIGPFLAMGTGRFPSEGCLNSMSVSFCGPRWWLEGSITWASSWEWNWSGDGGFTTLSPRTSGDRAPPTPGRNNIRSSPSTGSKRHLMTSSWK